jgi:PadR family transcriptional regulator
MSRPLGMTSLRILAAIRDGNAYGLDLVARTGLASGTVYPTLARLRRSGLVETRWEDQRVAEREGRPRRRYYRLTADGARALEDGAARVAEAAAALATVVGGSVG